MYSAINFVKDESWYSLPFTLKVLGCSRRSFYRYMNLGLVAFAEPTEENPRRRFLGNEIKRFREVLRFKKSLRRKEVV